MLVSAKSRGRKRDVKNNEQPYRANGKTPFFVSQASRIDCQFHSFGLQPARDSESARPRIGQFVLLFRVLRSATQTRRKCKKLRVGRVINRAHISHSAD